MEKEFYVYILTRLDSKKFYVGLTSNLPKRIYEHRKELADGYTKEHSIKTLVYYEVYKDAENAMKRERRLKKWNRIWKIELIEKFNPEWKDLYEHICN
jgi:putative endonuclease